jgi:putative solute:sodium symporter small subunit
VRQQEVGNYTTSFRGGKKVPDQTIRTGHSPADQSTEVSFFRPKSEFAKANTRLISVLVIVWAIAVFGFQFLLIGFGKPVAEESMEEFRTLWPEVQASPAESELQDFARVLLYTLGKNTTLTADARELLEQALAITLGNFKPAVDSPEEAAARIGFSDDGFDPLLRAQLLHHYGTSSESFGSVSGLPQVMEKYLVHKRSFLTDFRFLGFPFHYFYTAQFLLILFIVLCIVYAVAVDKINTRLGIEE